MQVRELGAGGPKLSVVGLGCNNFGSRMDSENVAPVAHAALDAGITHFDTAEMYGGGHSEEFLGAALGARRSEVAIATKFTPRPNDEAYRPGVLADRIRTAVEGSLRRLGTDYIDVYYQHYPDADGPVEEALETLNGLVKAGKVLYLANSNVSAAQITRAGEVAADRGWARFTGTQIEWSLLSRDVEESIVPAATATGLGVVPFFPLASGMLTGKYRKDEPYPEDSRLGFAKKAGAAGLARFATDENFAKVDAYTAFATANGHTVTELAIGWLLAQPSVTSVIAGATKPEQVAANVAAASWALSAAEADTVAALG
jgi:aryl-alcohol dehydrogenase-like predicted oxidoreductase